MWAINLLTGDIIEKCLLSTFMRVVLHVGEIQLGKNLVRLDWEKAVYRLLFTLVNTLIRQYNFIHIAQYFCVYPVFQ